MYANQYLEAFFGILLLSNTDFDIFAVSRDFEFIINTSTEILELISRIDKLIL